MIINKPKYNKGMTAIELVIVLGIFTFIASTVVFNYGKFQSKVDIKNLANEIAIKITEAQRGAVAGKINSSVSAGWKPAYGVLFNTAFNNKFLYFIDLDNSNTCTGAQCSTFTVGGEVLEVITITKGNTIPVSGLQISGAGCPSTVSNLAVVFTRPDSSPSLTSSQITSGCTPTEALINVSSPVSMTGKIRIYATGRIQMN